MIVTVVIVIIIVVLVLVIGVAIVGEAHGLRSKWMVPALVLFPSLTSRSSLFSLLPPSGCGPVFRLWAAAVLVSGRSYARGGVVSLNSNRRVRPAMVGGRPP